MRKDKAIPLLAGLVIVATVTSRWDWIREEYYAYKLRSGSETEKVLAVEQLGSSKSPGTLPRLLMALKVLTSECPTKDIVSQELRHQLESAIWERIAAMGEKAMPTLIQGMFDEMPKYARKCYRLARRIYLDDFPDIRERLVWEDVSMNFEREPLWKALQRIEAASELRFELRQVDPNIVLNTAIVDEFLLSGLDRIIIDELALCLAIKKDGAVVIGPWPGTFIDVLKESTKWDSVIRKNP